jgi:hypothetical protein
MPGARAGSPVSATQEFEGRLRTSLDLKGVTLASAQLARREGAPVWILVVRLREGLMELQVPMARSVDPFSLPYVEAIASRVQAYLARQRPR